SVYVLGMNVCRNWSGVVMPLGNTFGNRISSTRMNKILGGFGDDSLGLGAAVASGLRSPSCGSTAPAGREASLVRKFRRDVFAPPALRRVDVGPFMALLSLVGFSVNVTARLSYAAHSLSEVVSHWRYDPRNLWNKNHCRQE